MQHWTKIPGLSQEDMETFFQNALLPGSELKHHGVIPQMDPVFVTCDFVKGTDRHGVSRTGMGAEP